MTLPAPAPGLPAQRRTNAEPGVLARVPGAVSAGMAAVPPPALVVASILSVQLGSALAKTLFTQVPAVGVVALRLVGAAAALCLLWPPRRLSPTRAQWAVLVLFGIDIALMNLMFYEAIARVPLGVAVTVEFLGPMGVAIASSRRWLDLVWVAMAGAGVLLLSWDHPAGGLDPVGIGFALLAGAGWAGYILLNRLNGRHFADGSGLALAMLASAVVMVPFGLAGAGNAVFRPGAAVLGLGVGLLSSAIPYALEMEALRRIPAGLFGLLMSLEPAIAALCGWAVLGERLGLAAWAAIACVAAACAGATWAGQAAAE